MMAAEGNDGGIARCDEGPRDEIEDSDERKQYPSMPSDTYTFLFSFSHLRRNGNPHWVTFKDVNGRC